jgi:hypothetical protein
MLSLHRKTELIQAHTLISVPSWSPEAYGDRRNVPCPQLRGGQGLKALKPMECQLAQQESDLLTWPQQELSFLFLLSDENKQDYNLMSKQDDSSGWPCGAAVKNHGVVVRHRERSGGG